MQSDLALYVHFPWCVKKCPYCDFNSHPVTGAIPEAAYLTQLRADLDAELADLPKPSIATIFIGGGTPSLCSAAGVQRFLDHVRSVTDLAADAEVTLEANPGAVDRDQFAGFRAAGVNRLSIGAQSFQEEALNRLGRIHGPDDILRAVDAARDAGFARLNLDLMHGLPGQTVENACGDLDRAVAAEPEHLSWYQLTIEPRTIFARERPVLPAEDDLEAIETAGLDLLASAGYQRYEVSAYARPGQACLHNLNYWRFGDYLGIGAGAHGKLTDSSRGVITRTDKPTQPRLYLNAIPTALRNTTEVGTTERPAEFMMNALRLIDGVEESLFEERTGVPLEVIAARLEQLRRQGLMRRERLGLTEKGLRFLDGVVSRFL